MDLFQIILSPFVWLLMAFYNIFGDYGVALIIFALVVKAILFPFALKGKKGMIQMNMLNGQMQKLQKQYGKDKTRYNEEVQKLYAREKVNPMGGCLWTFIPLLVLLPLYAIIRQPMKYLMGLSPEQIIEAAKALNWTVQAVDFGWIKTAAAFADTGYNQLFLASLINENTLPAVVSALGEGTKAFAMNFQFFGINLSQIPQPMFWANGISWSSVGLFLLPLISAASGFVFSLISMKTNAVNTQSAAAANNSTSKMMLIISPLMSLWIGFAMPAALCIYWIANNLFSMLQEFISGKMLKKDYAKAAAAKEEHERQEKEEEKEQKRRAAEERALRLEEAKNNKGKKKQPAPKKKEEDEEVVPAGVKENSRVGMRQYARGRAYDPNRFASAPTPYHEPEQADFVKEEGSRELEQETELLERVALEAVADEAIIEALQEEQETEAAEESEAEYDEPENKA